MPTRAERVFRVLGALYLLSGCLGVLAAAPAVADWARFARTPRCAGTAADGCVRIVPSSIRVSWQDDPDRDPVVTVTYDGRDHLAVLARPGQLAAEIDGRTVRAQVRDSEVIRLEAPGGGWVPTRHDPATRAVPAAADSLATLALGTAFLLRARRGRWDVAAVAAAGGMIAAENALNRAGWLEVGRPLAAFAGGAVVAAVLLLVIRRARAGSPRTPSAAPPAAP